MKMLHVFQVIPNDSIRKRQIIWFNPHYSANVKTNFGKIFMRLVVDKYFPCHQKYFKLFNRNNIKLSYSCMPNINNVILKHNSKIMKNPASSTALKIKILVSSVKMSSRIVFWLDMSCSYFPKFGWT